MQVSFLEIFLCIINISGNGSHTHAFACIITNVLAIALPSLRISPLLLVRIATIVLSYVAALYLSVVYIQSIGSDIGIFSGLFQGTLTGQSI